MKIKQLKEFLNKFDEDFEIKINYHRELSSDELEELLYPYPSENIEIELNTKDGYDVGYSDKVVCLSLTEK